jgi:hypothetical protein
MIVMKMSAWNVVSLRPENEAGCGLAAPVAPLTSTCPPLICLQAWRPERF